MSIDQVNQLHKIGRHVLALEARLTHQPNLGGAFGAYQACLVDPLARLTHTLDPVAPWPNPRLANDTIADPGQFSAPPLDTRPMTPTGRVTATSPGTPRAGSPANLTDFSSQSALAGQPGSDPVQRQPAAMPPVASSPPATQRRETAVTPPSDIAPATRFRPDFGPVTSDPPPAPLDSVPAETGDSPPGGLSLTRSRASLAAILQTNVTPPPVDSAVGRHRNIDPATGTVTPEPVKPATPLLEEVPAATGESTPRQAIDSRQGEQAAPIPAQPTGRDSLHRPVTAPDATPSASSRLEPDAGRSWPTPAAPTPMAPPAPGTVSPLAMPLAEEMPVSGETHLIPDPFLSTEAGFSPAGISDVTQLDQLDQVIESLVDQLELAFLRMYGTSGGRR